MFWFRGHPVHYNPPASLHRPVAEVPECTSTRKPTRQVRGRGGGSGGSAVVVLVVGPAGRGRGGGLVLVLGVVGGGVDVGLLQRRRVEVGPLVRLQVVLVQSLEQHGREHARFRGCTRVFKSTHKGTV